MRCETTNARAAKHVRRLTHRSLLHTRGVIKDLSQEEAGRKKKREFGVVFVTYVGSGADARPAQVPRRCPCHGEGGECRIQVKDRRERKAGPDVWLTRFVCVVHKLGFTGYPHRWLPYRRAPLQWSAEEFETVIAAIMESEVIVETKKARAEDVECSLRWLETDFDAVAKTHILSWSKLAALRPKSHPQTRGRHIERAAKLVGVAEGEATLNAVQLALDVKIGVLVDARRAYANATRWRARAQAVMSVLSVLHDDGWRRLVHVAFLAGLCGQAWEVQGDSGRLMALF